MRHTCCRKRATVVALIYHCMKVYVAARAVAPNGGARACNKAQAPTGEMAETPPSIRKSAPTTYAESSDAR